MTHIGMEKHEVDMVSVTKYDPKYRDPDGIFRKDSWIGMWDIGKEYDGQLFTLEAYVEVENSYVEAIRQFLEPSNNRISLTSVEHYDVTHDGIYWSGLDEKKVKGVREGDVMGIEDVMMVSRAVLRELVWLRFESLEPARVVWFGYDFYMFFSPAADARLLAGSVSNLGLFLL